MRGDRHAHKAGRVNAMGWMPSFNRAAHEVLQTKTPHASADNPSIDNPSGLASNSAHPSNSCICPGVAPCTYSGFACVRPCAQGALRPTPVWAGRSYRSFFSLFSLRCYLCHPTLTGGVGGPFSPTRCGGTCGWNKVLKLLPRLPYLFPVLCAQKHRSSSLP